MTTTTDKDAPPSGLRDDEIIEWRELKKTHGRVAELALLFLQRLSDARNACGAQVEEEVTYMKLYDGMVEIAGNMKKALLQVFNHHDPDVRETVREAIAAFDKERGI
jgi:hypothetical protein